MNAERLNVWSNSDKRYLRSLRIEFENPPQPLPRFQVEPSETEGEYSVIDRLNQYRETHVIAAHFENPREMADAIANELNEKHERQA